MLTLRASRHISQTPLPALPSTFDAKTPFPQLPAIYNALDDYLALRWESWPIMLAMRHGQLTRGGMADAGFATGPSLLVDRLGTPTGRFGVRSKVSQMLAVSNHGECLLLTATSMILRYYPHSSPAYSLDVAVLPLHPQRPHQHSASSNKENTHTSPDGTPLSTRPMKPSLSSKVWLTPRSPRCESSACAGVWC
jgi:hypothetical protein